MTSTHHTLFFRPLRSILLADIYNLYYKKAFEQMGARISSNSWGARNGSYIMSERHTGAPGGAKCFCVLIALF
jgi:hypothetical protein